MKVLRSQGIAKLFGFALLWVGLAVVFSKSAPAVDAPTRVAFLTITDVSGAPAWRAKAISDSVNERLKVIPGWAMVDRAQVVAAEGNAAKSGAKGTDLRSSVAAALKANIVFQVELKESAGSLVANITALQDGTAKGPQEATPAADIEAVLGLPAALAKGAVAVVGAKIPGLTEGFVASPESKSVKAFELFAQGASLAGSNLDNAEKALRSALKEDPDYARAAALLSKVLCFQSDAFEDKTPLLEEALALASQAVKLLSASPEAHVALGRVHASAGRTSKAALEYSEAIKLAPFEVTALNNRGLIFSDSRQYRLARQDFEAALAANPDYIAARIGLGRASIDLGDGAGAASILSPLVETPPPNPFLQKLAVEFYAEALSMSGGSGLAKTTLEDYAATNPEEQDISKYLGIVQLNSGNYPEAIKLLEEYLTKAPESPEGKQLLAWATYKNGDAKAAIERLTELTTKLPRFIPAWRDLGLIQALSGDFAAAKTTFSSGLGYTSEDPELTYNIGVAALAVENLAKADEFFVKATTLDPSFSQAWYNLGVTRTRARKAKEAKEAFERAAQLSPKDASIKIGLGLALRSSDPAAAKKALQEAVDAAKDPSISFQAKLNLGLLCAEQKDEACAKEALGALSKDAPAGFEESASHAKQVLDALQGRAP